MNEDYLQITDRLVKIHREIEAPGSTDLARYLAASDIHGNVSRLREILAIAEREQITRVFLVGDIYSGPGGWSLYRMLRPLVEEANVADRRIVPLFGNHELAFVTGMLGQDKQLRFFYGFGGLEMIQELNEELAESGQPAVPISGGESPTPEDLAHIRASEHLLEMARWIQKTHRIFARDTYGTGYLHACPKITRHGRLDVQYQGTVGPAAIGLMEQDLAVAERCDHPVFTPLLQTDKSPLWALFQITSGEQFDHVFHPAGVRQLVFGHRHRTEPVNIGGLNRQIGIAVDFDEGLGGYLIVGPEGLIFHSFIDTQHQQTRPRQLIAASGGLDARETYLRDTEEFFVRQFVKAEKAFFDAQPARSANARREFNKLEKLRRYGLPWSQRVYAEIYPHVKDVSLREKIFSVVVESCDEEAFRSMIHLVHHKTNELQNYGSDWYAPGYVEAKSILQVLLRALREMPLRRLGLLDMRLRGTTSRANLMELYERIMELQDPDLAMMAAENLGALDYWVADQELRRAFFHDARKVRVRAARELARRGEVAYPLVESLMTSRDNWVRFLACWTVAKLGEQDRGMAGQAIRDIREALEVETDWLIQTSGEELLRKLGDADAASLPDRQLEIPNLTSDVMDVLQGIVDSQQEPFRRAFKVYFITVSISSLVYRRGLIGMDLDELRIYVNRNDYFPPHFRFFKSATRDEHGQLQGWRSLWIRGETFNRPDGPNIIELGRSEGELPPMGRQTIILYDHREANRRVRLPELDAVVAQFGLGKAKDRVRDALLDRWPSFSDQDKQLLCRLHAAAAVKMLFDLPSEVFVNSDELGRLRAMTAVDFVGDVPKPLISLDRPGKARDQDLAHTTGRHLLARPNWVDANKYPVHVFAIGGAS